RESGRHEQSAVFDLFFRKNPFHGEYTLFAGLGEVLKFLANFKVTDNDIEYLRSLNLFKEGYLHWLQHELDMGDLKIYSLYEGTVCFPRVPLIRVEGPIATAQLIETTLLCLVNYASLICTNAARFRHCAGREAQLLEFGLRRAQGPDGALSASRYAYMGGFDGTSNVLAGKMLGIPIKGTHAHSFVTSFTGLEEVRNNGKSAIGNTERPFLEICLEYRKELKYHGTNEGELAAFVDYALSFPTTFLALVDSYDTLKSGVPNYLTVACALRKVGLTPHGIRLDSGDLSYLSVETRAMFRAMDDKYPELVDADFKFGDMPIVASNDINEATLSSLKSEGHEITSFGIGTNLVTCQNQPALGCVYKLVEIDNKPRIKLSNEISKVTLPGRKKAFRLVNHKGIAMLDILTAQSSEIPSPGQKVLCRHPFIPRKRAYVTPTEVIPLMQLMWANGSITKESRFERTSQEIRQYVREQILSIRPDIRRKQNPSPYKVSVTEELFQQLHNLWLQETPIEELDS
ncbi:nicotinate phosphoribosyltransferase, partial [Sphaeroforma arctica JP610]